MECKIENKHRRKSTQSCQVGSSNQSLSNSSSNGLEEIHYVQNAKENKTI